MEWVEWWKKKEQHFEYKPEKKKNYKYPFESEMKIKMVRHFSGVVVIQKKEQRVQQIKWRDMNELRNL